MRIRTALYLFAAATLAGCNPVITCTLIGCHNGLVVQFDRMPTQPFRVEAIVPNDPAQHVVECDANRCPHVLFPDLLPEQVTIRVTTAAGTRTQEFRPKYENLYPNGRRCGPACRQATVTVQVPG